MKHPPPARHRRRRVGKLALAGLSGLIVSCTALPPPQEWFGPSTQNTRRKSREPAPPPRQETGDLSWHEVVRIARERNPTIAAAMDRVRRAEALLHEAEALAYPRLDARGSYVRFLEATDFRGRTGSDVGDEGTRSRFFTGRNTDIYSGGIDLRYPLFDGGDAYYARKSSEASLQSSREAAETVRQGLEFDVSAAFLNVLLSAGAIRIAEETLRFTEDQVRRAQARQDAGEGLQVDTLRFATQASEERLVLNQAQAQKKVRLAVLAELLGVTFADDVQLIEPTRELDAPQGDVVSIALRGRSELRSIDARIVAATGSLSREKSLWWPAIDLFASYGFVTVDELDLDQRKDEFQVGGALSMNLYEGGATTARTTAREHELAELRSLRQELLLRIAREVREAEANLEVSRRNVNVSRETVALAEEVLRQVDSQYSAGEAQVLDVTEATLQRGRAQLALLRSRINLVLSQARLRRAAGLGVLTEP